MPDVRAQAYDELSAHTRIIPPACLIDALTCYPPDRHRVLNPYEQQVLRDFAARLNDRSWRDANDLFDQVKSASDPADHEVIEAVRSQFVEEFQRIDLPKERSPALVISTAAPSESPRSFRRNPFAQDLLDTARRLGPECAIQRVAEVFCTLNGQAFVDCREALLDHLGELDSATRSATQRPPRRKGDNYAELDFFPRMLAAIVFRYLVAVVKKPFRDPLFAAHRQALLEFGLMLVERPWPWRLPLADDERIRVADDERDLLRQVASFTLAQIRSDIKKATREQAAERMRQSLADCRRSVRTLVAVGPLSQVLRQLVLLLRDFPAPAVERDLRYWGECQLRLAPCDAVVRDMVKAVHLYVSALGQEPKDLKTARRELASFCLSRVQAQPRGQSSSGGLEMIEPDPTWRIGYLRALDALEIDPEGKGHRTLYWLQANDPDPAVRGVAGDIYPRLRQGKWESSESPRRPFITAIWWLLQAHLVAIGETVDYDRVDLTREAFLRRTRDGFHTTL